jgi:mRNA interferase RelE/StbE
VKYTLVYTHRASKDIRKLEENIKSPIGKALLRYSADPFKHAEKITDPRLGSYRFRIGDYRVIFDFEGTEIVMLRLGHRKEIYQKI